MVYYDRSELLDKFDDSSWERVLYSEMEAALTSKTRLFPCVFGVAGFVSNNLRFAFVDRITPETVAPLLRGYLPNARDTGKKASLVVFEKPSPVESMEVYRGRFWALLDGLARLDESDWPAEGPEVLDHPLWEFCFAGEPIFVVCNTPAHIQRQSRESADQAFGTVRKRLNHFDIVGLAPALGRYGDDNVREYAQYFIDDENHIPGCPMKALAAHGDVSRNATAKEFKT